MKVILWSENMKGTFSELNVIRKNIEEWQNSIFVHPLTCGNDSQNHDPLMPQLEKHGDEFELYLVCKNCDWKQDIPLFFRS